MFSTLNKTRLLTYDATIMTIHTVRGISIYRCVTGTAADNQLHVCKHVTQARLRTHCPHARGHGSEAQAWCTCNACGANSPTHPFPPHPTPPLSTPPLSASAHPFCPPHPTQAAPLPRGLPARHAAHPPATHTTPVLRQRTAHASPARAAQAGRQQAPATPPPTTRPQRGTRPSRTCPEATRIATLAPVAARSPG